MRQTRRTTCPLVISKGKCTWTKPMEIAGTQTKEDVGTSFDEVRGKKSRGHGYVVGILANGDEMYVRTQGSATMKDRVMEGAEGTTTGNPSAKAYQAG